jgi:hypothetical protein
MWSTSLDPQLQNRCKCIPPIGDLFSLYMRVLNFGKIKLRCHWECLKEQLRNLGTLKGTWCAHAENTLGTKKINKKNNFPPCHPTPKRKKTRRIMSACWASHWLNNFQNCRSPYLDKAIILRSMMPPFNLLLLFSVWPKVRKWMNKPLHILFKDTQLTLDTSDR